MARGALARRLWRRRGGAAGAPPRGEARRARRRPLRRARRQDGAARERRRQGARGRSLPASAQAPRREHGAPASRGRDQGRGRADARGRTLRRRPPRRALLGDRHHPPPSGRAMDEARGGPCEACRPAGAAPRQGGGVDAARRAPHLLHLLARAGGGRAPGRELPRPQPRLRARAGPRRRAARPRRGDHAERRRAHASAPGRRGARGERPRRLLHRPLLASRPLTGHDPVKAALTNNAHRNEGGAASGGEGAGVKWGPDRWRLYGLALREAGRAVLASVAVAPRILSPSAKRVLIAPQDLRTSDPTIASDVYAGCFVFAGRAVSTGGRSPFACDPPSRAWAELLCGVGGLRSLRASVTVLARANVRAIVV